MSNEAIIPVCIKNGIEEAFKVQVGKSVRFLKNPPEELSADEKQFDCMSVLGMQSSTLAGSLAICFPKKTFLKIVEQILGEKYETITDENADACGELLNIIYASSRTKINQEGFDFQPAIPSTLRGNDLSMTLEARSKVVEYICDCDLGFFTVLLKLKKVVAEKT